MRENGGISIKALALGALTDIGGSLIFGFALGLIVIVVWLAQGIPLNQLAGREKDPILVVPVLIAGWGFTLLGGFVAGRVAKKSEVMHGGLVGLIAVLTGICFWGSTPLWYGIVSLLGVIPFGMAGGRLSVVKRSSISNGSVTD